MTSSYHTAAREPVATHTSTSWFYRGMAVAFLVTVIVGFSASSQRRIASGAPGLEPLVVLHATLFASWFVIFLMQTTFVATGRVATHRRLGVAAAVVAALLTVDGPLMAIAAARRGHLGPDGLAFMLVMMVDVLGFAVCVAAAIWWRRNPETHKRCMLLGTTSMLPPAISRWPLLAGHLVGVPIVLLAFLAAAPLRDLLTRRRVHPVSLWGGLALFASGPLRLVIAHSAAWHQVALWLIHRI